MINVEQNFETFINEITQNVHREGIDKLIAWLKAKDTKIAPASTKYHLACEGGLVEHSLNVYNTLKKLLRCHYGPVAADANGEMYDPIPYTSETIAIVALLHDISKVNYYTIGERNTKDENGNWIKVPFYQVKEAENRLIFGSHSMNSFYMISKFIKLDYEEELAILHHMGGLDVTEDTLTVKNTTEAWIKSPLALLLHQADMQATFLIESNNE